MSEMKFPVKSATPTNHLNQRVTIRTQHIPFFLGILAATVVSKNVNKIIFCVDIVSSIGVRVMKKEMMLVKTSQGSARQITAF